ncbi:hypothetical protein CHH57_19615 [Niallia circulans]|uniref:Uncharacterized protein n=1 Tax=Niallia circulans TaxID=1397 RepID=A0AA91TNT8_NIACI|nr:hypothetical protein [Niallia circulans]PAD81469.1 hypothetical protein CHH57_19615 [Niallia circulans]QJX60631.1 hypothetical protein HLK66_02480 [Niallia circulans]
MKTSTPCPNCNKSLTIEHFEDFPSPFNMKCPHCKAKLKETKMTPILILVTIIIIPLFILLGVTVKNFLTNFFPIVEKIPTAIIFLAFCYPVYALYEAFNAVIIFKGNLQLKKRQ